MKKIPAQLAFLVIYAAAMYMVWRFCLWFYRLLPPDWLAIIFPAMMAVAALVTVLSWQKRRYGRGR
jgi:uncharacterized membrane protein YfcA